MIYEFSVGSLPSFSFYSLSLMTARSPNHHSPPSSPSRLSRIAEIFRFSLYKSTTNFISLLAPRLKHIVSKTLDLLSMDSLFFSEDDDYYFDRYRNHHHQIQPLSEVNDDRLYFVPYRWWNEARQSLFRDLSEIEGLQYAVTLSGSRLGPVQIGGYGSQSEILLNLRREEDAEKHESTEEGASGGDCALVLEWMFLRALKWHNNAKDVENFIAAENSTWDLFPLQIRLSVLLDSTSLVVRITQKDNEVTAFNRACNIFCVKSGLFSIWDFSGQITQFFMNDKIKLSNEAGQSDAEILLELQVYGFSYCTRAIEGRNNEMEVEQSKIGDSCNSGLLKMNGSTDHVDSYFRVNSSTPFGRNYSGPCVLGLTGLYNLGNTCFMNSAIQCLVHTPELVDYFLGDYRKDVNTENPLGMNGELALAFGDLLRKLWTPGATSVAPHSFKSKLADFAPQFSGYNQHDSQEFLAFLLDGLHEDLNRVKCKPYIDLKDADDHPDEEVADEHWQNHLARNDSIIVDVCQGQYRSTLVCPACKKKSVTFDPFMYLSLPLPSTTMRMMTLTVVSTDGTALPFPVTITVPIYGRCKDLVQALSTACSLRDDETFLVAEIFNHHIIRLLDKPSDSIELIRDNDKLVAYRLPIDSEMSPLVAFNHERVERARHYNYIHGTSSLKKFGIPLVARISNLSRGSEIHKQFLKLLKPFLLPVENSLSDSDDVQNSGNKDFEMEDVVNTAVFGGDANSDSESGDYSHLGANFQFQLMEERGLYDLYPKGPKIQMNEPVQITGLPDIINVLVSWPNEMVELYDTCLLSTLPEICKTGLFTKKPQESVSLYKCLEAFLKEEPLGPEDMWYCPKCKKHQQASKKLDLWRLPEILVIHLKRFFYSRFLKNKLETFVDFPIDNFDLSSYIVCKDSRVSHHYMLYAVSNHYGSMGSGHYTAFVQHGHNRWYEFDDSHVLPVSEDQIKTSAAYVLFYRRI